MWRGRPHSVMQRCETRVRRIRCGGAHLEWMTPLVPTMPYANPFPEPAAMTRRSCIRDLSNDLNEPDRISRRHVQFMSHNWFGAINRRWGRDSFAGGFACPVSGQGKGRLPHLSPLSDIPPSLFQLSILNESARLKQRKTQFLALPAGCWIQRVLAGLRNYRPGTRFVSPSTSLRHVWRCSGLYGKSNGVEQGFFITP